MNKFAFIILLSTALVYSSTLKAASQIITKTSHIFDTEIFVSPEIKNISQANIEVIKKSYWSHSTRFRKYLK